MTTLKQIRCKNCEHKPNCEEAPDETSCELSLDDVREWLQQEQKEQPSKLMRQYIQELLEDLR